MSNVSRRQFCRLSAAGLWVAASSRAHAAEPHPPELGSLTTGVAPITAQEHAARVAKLQTALRQAKVAALLVDAGATLEYYTGVRWGRSERTTAALIPAEGTVLVVTPFFEEPSIRETLKVASEVRPWNEDESPFELLAAALRGPAMAQGPLAVEGTTRHFITDGVSRASGAGREVVSGDGLVRACRSIKSPAELALMQAANDVTYAALRHVHRRVEAGMNGADITAMMAAATKALGGKHEFALVLLNEASAYPHGSLKPQQVRDGSIVLVDAGCSVHGYQSDVSRTWVHGAANARQREIWNTVKRGQEIALETAKIGVPVGALDTAVRNYYEGRGWAKNYGLPGTSHRTGHGIGMEVHEPPNLVRNDTTPLEAGMCFSDEPGIYIPGEFGVRMEDCWYLTEAGPKLFTPMAASIERPI